MMVQKQAAGSTLGETMRYFVAVIVSTLLLVSGCQEALSPTPL